MLERLVSLAQDEVVVNLPDERLVLVNPQLRKERFSDLGKSLNIASAYLLVENFILIFCPDCVITITQTFLHISDILKSHK